MEEILWRKFEKHFDPEEYPTTDMIQEGEEAGTAETANEENQEEK